MYDCRRALAFFFVFAYLFTFVSLADNCDIITFDFSDDSSSLFDSSEMDDMEIDTPSSEDCVPSDTDIDSLIEKLDDLVEALTPSEAFAEGSDGDELTQTSFFDEESEISLLSVDEPNFLDKLIDDYSVTEGLLLLIFSILFFGGIIKFVSWNFFY